ncbi:MAG: TIGR01777 family oxidoreductase [Coraliomargaritaceae bacterium]
MDKIILVSGSSGMIGRALCEKLEAEGNKVRKLKRSSVSLNTNEYYWDPEKNEIDPLALEAVDCVVHLAGEPIAQRWNSKSKKAILESRILSTRLLVESLKLAESKAHFICSSGVNFYGSKVGRNKEGEGASINCADGFLSEVCHKWEVQATDLLASGNRVALLRTGVVLNKNGGALARMLPAFRLGLGGLIGSGEQWMSWIELEDLIQVILWSIHSGYSGAINSVAPYPTKNKDFVKALGQALKRPTILPMPEFLVNILFGSMGQETVLANIGIEPHVLKDSGFQWACPTVESALNKALNHVR